MVDGRPPTRKGSPFTEPDEDGPPPRKKREKTSRFFPGGRNAVGGTSGENGKTSETSENATPLIDDRAYTAQPRSQASSIARSDPSQSAIPPFISHRVDPSTQNPFTTRSDPAEPAQSSAKGRAAPSSKNSFTQAVTALKGFTGRDKRRNGIVGLSSLVPPAQDNRLIAYPTPDGPGDFVIGPPRVPHPVTGMPTSVRVMTPADTISVSAMSPEDAVRYQAAYGNANQELPQPPSSAQPWFQGTGQPRRQEQRPTSSVPQRRHLLPPSETQPQGRPPLESQQQRQPPPTSRDSGPLNAPPPQFNTVRIPFSNQGLQQPFLPRPQLPTGVDLDRDASGKKLPTQSLHPILNLPNQGITSLPKHATLTPSRRPLIPPTYYTSPNRLQNAILFSQSHKRKRPALQPPPAAFTYQRTNSPSFNIFAGILLYPELVFALASTLPLRSLVALYAISRDFHTILDTRFTTVILQQSLRKAPECSRAFPFRSYAHLCRKDPAARIPHPNPAAAAQGRVRLIPSFRWLSMILHREKVVHEMTALFAEDGVPLPLRCGLAIKKMWFILDIPDNARRIGFIHNTNLFTDLDLYFAMCFFIKLDMRLNDPVGPQKRDGMRKMLLAQETFTTVLKVLRRDAWVGRLDVLREWVKWKYEPRADEQGMEIFGVKFERIGKGRMEYWGRGVGLKREAALLLRPDQLVMREAIKRGLRFHKHFLRCLTYGYVRMDTLENYEPRKMNRRLEALKDEYEADDEIGGLTFAMEKAGLEDGLEGDVLDLGERKSVSLLCIDGGSQSLITPEDRRKTNEQEQFLEACMRWAGAEVEEGDVDARMLLD